MNRQIQRFLMDTHIFFYQKTHGIIGANLGGTPMLLLTTIGRKSGRERITPISYVLDEKRFVLLASNAGAQNHPQWWLNLQKHSQAHVQVGREQFSVTVHEALGEERKRLWSFITAKYPSFNKYQARISREIPVVVLSRE